MGSQGLGNPEETTGARNTNSTGMLPPPFSFQWGCCHRLIDRFCSEDKLGAPRDGISWRILKATQTYHVVLDKEEDGEYSVQCVEIPGAISHGDSREEAMRNIKEAIGLLLEHPASKDAEQRVEEVIVTT